MKIVNLKIKNEETFEPPPPQKKKSARKGFKRKHEYEIKYKVGMWGKKN